MRRSFSIMTLFMGAAAASAQPTPAQPQPPSMVQTEDNLSGKTPPKGERGGDQKKTDGTQTGWSGQWKTPQDDKSQASRNEAEGQAIKKPGEK